MKDTIKIGETDVGMVANAATPHVYKMIFHDDLFQKFNAAEQDIEAIEKLGFVMAKQAETDKLAELMKNNEDSFYEWLIQFDFMDMMDALAGVVNLYQSQKKGTSVPKSAGG